MATAVAPITRPSLVSAPHATASDLMLGAVCAVVAILLLTRAGGHHAAAIAAVALCAAVAPALARIDIESRRLPNVVTVPLLVVAGTASVARAVMGDPWPLAAAAGCAALLALLAVVGGMGMGDVKLGAALALATGLVAPHVAVLGVVASFVLGGLGGVVALAAGQRTLAFGPWLLAGSAVSTVLLA